MKSVWPTKLLELCQVELAQAWTLESLGMARNEQVLHAGSNVHLLLKNCGSSEPKPTAKVTEITEGEEAPAEAATEEKDGATSEIIPLATRTKEGMAALVKVLKGLPGRAPTPHVPPHGGLSCVLDRLGQWPHREGSPSVSVAGLCC